jgi:hypothetical protein
MIPQLEGRTDPSLGSCHAHTALHTPGPRRTGQRRGVAGYQGRERERGREDDSLGCRLWGAAADVRGPRPRARVHRVPWGVIVSGSNDCKIKVWDAKTGVCLRTLVGHTALVRALAFDPERGRLVSAGYDRTVKVWDLNSGAMVREFRGEHASHIFDVRFDVRRIVSTSHDQKVSIFDFGTGLDTTLFV